MSLSKNALSALALVGTGGNHGQAYTDGEKNFFAGCMAAILIAQDIKVEKPVDLPAEDLAILEAAAAESTSVTGCMAAAYRSKVKGLDGFNKETDEVDGNTDFPKLRDPTSIRILTRGAIKAIGAPESVLDEVAPKYGKAKAKGKKTA